MKKRIISAALAAAMTMSLMTGSALNVSASEEITLTFPTFWVGENVGAVYFEPAVERFNEQYAGQYHIELEEVVEDTYIEKMTQMAQAGNLPTLVVTTSSSAEFVQNVLIANDMYYPMNDFLEEHPEIAELCIDSSTEFCTEENGNIVCMPIVTLSNVGLYYNSALYSPEKNISEMTVDEFVESLGDNTIAFQSVDNAWTSMLFLTALIANEEGGAELLQEYDGGKLLDFNQEPILNAVTKLKEIWSTNATSNAVGAAYADAANIFMADQAAVICNGAWMNSEFGEEGSGNWSNDFDGANVRADYYPGNVALCKTKSYGRYVMTNCGTEEERECAEAFLAFIYSQEELEKFALTEGCQVPNMDYSEEFLASLEENPLIKAQTEMVTEETTIVPPLSNIMVSSVANDVFANDLIQLATGALTPEAFCQDLTTKSQESAEN